MEDDTGTPAATGETPPDPLTNFKAEQSRKYDNINQQLQSLTAANAVLVEKLTQLAPPAARRTEASEDLSSIMYSDPAKYAQIIEDRAESRIMEKLSAKDQAQGRLNSVMAELHTDFPELNDPNNDLTKKAGEIFARLSDEEKKSSLALKLAVKDAATELGVKPKRMRPNEDFMDGGTSSSGAGRERKKNDKIDPITEFWGEELGLDMKDPAVRARLQARSERKWEKYQKPLPIQSRNKGKK